MSTNSQDSGHLVPDIGKMNLQDALGDSFRAPESGQLNQVIIYSVLLFLIGQIFCEIFE